MQRKDEKKAKKGIVLKFKDRMGIKKTEKTEQNTKKERPVTKEKITPKKPEPIIATAPDSSEDVWRKEAYDVFWEFAGKNGIVRLENYSAPKKGFSKTIAFTTKNLENEKKKLAKKSSNPATVYNQILYYIELNINKKFIIRFGTSTDDDPTPDVKSYRKSLVYEALKKIGKESKSDKQFKEAYFNEVVIASPFDGEAFNKKAYITMLEELVGKDKTMFG